jgi:acylaminoacyl-peptidase
MRLSTTLLLPFALAAAAVAAQPATAPPASPPAAKQAFTAADLVRLRRISDPQVSPDGRWVAFTLRETAAAPTCGCSSSARATRWCAA